MRAILAGAAERNKRERQGAIETESSPVDDDKNDDGHGFESSKGSGGANGPGVLRTLTTTEDAPGLRDDRLRNAATPKCTKSASRAASPSSLRNVR